MTGRTHDLAAFTAVSYIITNYSFSHLSLATVLFAFGANMIGGIAPDIDQPTSKIWHSLPLGGLWGHLADPVLGGHRTISHSLLGLAIFGFVSHYFIGFIHSFKPIDVNIVWWSFMIGFISHLVMDTFTHEGVMWFFPIPIHIGIPPIRAFRIKTGGLIEKSFIFPILLMINIYLYWSHYQTVYHLLKTIVT